MAEKTFNIGIKAEALFASVFDATTSRNHYPVRFKRLADRMQDCVSNIYCDAIDANEMPINTQSRKDAKFDLQTRVISNCKKMLMLSKYSLEKKMISGATCELWTGLIMDIKYMTLAWRSKNT